MNQFKHMKKILKQCIYQLDESSSLFVVNPEKDFTSKKKTPIWKHIDERTAIRRWFIKR